jgi:PmbA protein
MKEVYYFSINELDLTIQNTEITSIRKKDIGKTGVRAYGDGKISIAGGLGEVSEKKLYEKALSSLSTGIPYPFEPEQDKIRKEKVISSDLLENEAFVGEVEKILASLRKEYNDFSFFHKAKIIENERELRNESGVDLFHSVRYVSLQFAFKSKDTSNIMDGFVGYEGKDFNGEAFLEHAAEVLDGYRNTVDFPGKGIYPLIFLESDRLPLQKLTQDLHGSIFGTGGSPLSGQLDQQVFSPDFTLYQTGNPEDTFAPFFDSEGVTNDGDRYPLIRNGKVISPYTDKKISNRFELPLTGCAGGDYDDVPTLSTPGLKVASSGKTLKELLDQKQGIFVMICAGGDFTPEGNFGSPVQLAFLHDGTRIVGRLPELKISSKLNEMFGPSFRGLSVDPFFPLARDKFLVMDMEADLL